MPNVPKVPGVPTLSSYVPNAVILLAADAVSLLFGGLANPWGVFLDGEVAFDYDSFNALSFRKESAIADYQIEGEGGASGFMSYDKVALPFECRVRLVVGGSEARREALIAAVAAAQEDLELYDILTPERLYEGCNILRHTYERTSSEGVGLVKIDITFQEIRSSEVTAFSNTQQPGSAAQQGLGNVQPASSNGPGSITSLPLGKIQ